MVTTSPFDCLIFSSGGSLGFGSFSAAFWAGVGGGLGFTWTEKQAASLWMSDSSVVSSRFPASSAGWASESV